MPRSLSIPSRNRALQAGGLLFIAGAAATVAPQASIAASSDRAAIERALADSAAAWSANDLARFMAIYENSPATTYLKAGGVVQGYQAIRSVYAARFGRSPAAMGTLSTELLDVRALGPSYALCIGRFSLSYPDQAAKPAAGMFSLVFHRGAGGWKIVSDHTSS